jgi:hypothetical protein
MINALGEVGGIRITRIKPIEVLFCLPQVPHNLISNSGRGGKPETNRLSYGRTRITVLNNITTSQVNEHFETYPRKNEHDKCFWKIQSPINC